jgi:spore coat polysaccharide biosynthesis protein SpsF (cytidylyltransferase family)
VRTIAIIQARLNSARLPGKVLLPIGGKPMLGHVIDRVRQAKLIDVAMVATGSRSINQSIIDYCHNAYVYCYAGHDTDVLDRYHEAMWMSKADVIVRITGDCPMMDPALIDHLIEQFCLIDCDYLTNTMPPTYPDGLDVEVFSAAVLARAWAEATLPSEREHVTPWMRSHCRTVNVTNPRGDESRWRLCVDEQTDLDLIGAIFGELGSDCTWQQALALLRERPDLVVWNAHIVRNSGYAKSMREDGNID